MNKVLGTCVIVAILAMLLTSCAAPSGPVTLPPTVAPQGDALTSIPAKVPPHLDGSADDLIWQAAPARALDVKTDGIPPFQVTLKSAYDAEYLYVMVQYPDLNQDVIRAPWVYDAEKRAWGRLDDSLGDEDEFGFYWNVNVPDFPTTGCTPLCHEEEGGKTRMYTPAGSWIDIWQWNAVRSNPMGWGRDLMLTEYADFEANGGFVPDEGSNQETSGHIDNLQTLNGIDVPAYWKPYSGVGGLVAGDAIFLLQSEIDAGYAKKIVAVDAQGMLTGETGAVVPTYARIPGRILGNPDGPSWNDIQARGAWLKGVWTVELARKLTTGHKDDMAFDPAKEYYFGMYFKTRQVGEVAREQMPLAKLVFAK